MSRIGQGHQDVPIQESSLLLISYLLKTLSHQIRTPLSIISNDLSYLKTITKPEECDRSVAKCLSISDILKSASELGTRPIERKKLDLNHIVSKLFSTSGSASKVIIEGDNERLNSVLTMISTLLKLITKDQISYEVNKGVLTFSLMVKKELNKVWNITSTNSFTYLFSYVLELDSLYPPLIDCVLLAHAAKVEIRAIKDLSTLTITIEFNNG